MTTAIFDYYFTGGALRGIISDAGLQQLSLFPALRQSASCAHPGPEPLLRSLFDGYFAGEPVDFSPIPLDLSRGTPFQQKVWRATTRVGWGETISYGSLARALGKPGAARAVGTALGANPLCIVVPCHRVLASDGGLGGYALGVDWKRRFLTLERGDFSTVPSAAPRPEDA